MTDPEFLRICGVDPSETVSPLSLPFCEKRTVILDDSLPFRLTAELTKRIRDQKFEASIDSADERLLRRHAQIATALTFHYGIEEHTDEWTFRIIARVLFSPWCSEYCGFVNDFLQPHNDVVQVRTDNPSVDWWLFASLEGVPEASLLTDRVYLLIGHVFPPTATYEERIRVFAFSEQITSRLSRRFAGREENWQTLVRRPALDLCRSMNEVAAHAWASLKLRERSKRVVRGQHQSEKS